LRKSFNYRGLSHPRLSDKYRIVLGPAGQNLDHPAYLVVTADYRVQFSLSRRFGKVLAVFGQGLVLFLRVLIGHPFVSAQVLEGGKRSIAGDAAVGEHGCHIAPLFLDESQQKVLGGNKLIVHGLGLAQRRIQSVMQRR